MKEKKWTGGTELQNYPQTKWLSTYKEYAIQRHMLYINVSINYQLIQEQCIVHIYFTLYEQKSNHI